MILGRAIYIILILAIIPIFSCAPLKISVLSSAKLAVKLYEANDVILESKNWIATLKKDQTYLGSATIRLKRVESSFGGLTDEELVEFRDVVRIMEHAAKESFGATHLNWSCLMNHGYRTWPLPIALVHIHFHPRYMQQTIVFNELTFVDEKPTEHYKAYTYREVPNATRKAIIQAYQNEILKIKPELIQK